MKMNVSDSHYSPMQGSNTGFYVMFYLRTYKVVDKVVFISAHSMSIVKQYIPDIEDKGLIIPHGLNSEFFDASATYELPENLSVDKFYLYVSRLSFYKGQKELINTWGKLSVDGF